MLKSEKSVYHGYVWIPEESKDEVETQLQFNSEKSQVASGQLELANAPKGALVPSYIKTNEVSYFYQEIVNTYGIPRYGEINPGLFTVITFSFLFGVMFGDIAHGSVLFLFGNIAIYTHIIRRAVSVVTRECYQRFEFNSSSPPQSPIHVHTHGIFCDVFGLDLQ
jgi:V-type H+-transporting ATPase subunit a